MELLTGIIANFLVGKHEAKRNASVGEGKTVEDNPGKKEVKNHRKKEDEDQDKKEGNDQPGAWNLEQNFWSW